MIDGGSSMKPGGPRAPAPTSAPNQQSMANAASGAERPTAASKVEAKLRGVSQLYEKQFMREMLKAMRSTVQESGFIKTNQAERIFREQLDDNYVDQWSDRGGVGLSDLIYTQLVEKFGARLGLKEQALRPTGPIALNARSQFVGRSAAAKAADPSKPSSAPEQTWRFDRELVDERRPAQPVEVTAPWDGILLGTRRLDDDQQVVEIGHDNGLKSRLVYRGQAERLIVGRPVQAGETVGLLSGDAKALFWTVQDNGKGAPDVEKNQAK